VESYIPYDTLQTRVNGGIEEAKKKVLNGNRKRALQKMFGLTCGGNIVVLDYLSLLIDGTIGIRVK